MNLRLVRADLSYEKEIVDMLKEWEAYNIEHPEANKSPGAIFEDYSDFNSYIEVLEAKSRPGLVDSTTLFCLDEDRNIMVGAIDIRHELNEHLAKYGGHIGDGIRPSERRKGYATAMIGLGLKECKKLGLDRVLLICDKDNIGSAKSIQNNGGILDSEDVHEGKVIQRYWIDIE